MQDDNLEGKYKDWQKKLHPDLVHLKSEVGPPSHELQSHIMIYVLNIL